MVVSIAEEAIRQSGLIHSGLRDWNYSWPGTQPSKKFVENIPSRYGDDAGGGATLRSRLQHGFKASGRDAVEKAGPRADLRQVVRYHDWASPSMLPG